MNHKTHRKKGFTLIEVLVVIGIIAILAGVVLVAVSPGKQFKQARDTQRVANVNTILNAIGQNISDHQGLFFCGGSVVNLGNQWSLMSSDTIDGAFNIAECLVPEYLPKLPFDPSKGDFENEDSYDLGYHVKMDDQGRISVKADGELTTEILVTR